MAYKSYSEKLKSPKWQERRLRIMERDGFKCIRCGSDEKTLNVHHKVYKKGREVYQYALNDLETLCVDCHFNEHFDKPIAPAKHWEGVYDRIPSQIEGTICRLQEKLKQPLADELQESILRHIMVLQGRVGARG